MYCPAWSLGASTPAAKGRLLFLNIKITFRAGTPPIYRAVSDGAFVDMWTNSARAKWRWGGVLDIRSALPVERASSARGGAWGLRIHPAQVWIPVGLSKCVFG
jgi:hypothetical protein